MISETQQEQAALYVLGLLDADEAADLERTVAAEPELATLVRELRDTAASLALAAEDAVVAAPPRLKERVLRFVAAQAVPPSSTSARVVPMVRHPSVLWLWLPWAAVAALFYLCMQLVNERVASQNIIRGLHARIAAPLDEISKVSFLELEPTPDAPVKPRAAVLWDARQHRGVLRVQQLAPPAVGKDYQLWAVEAGRKEPVSAGLVHVDANGQAEVSFQPDPIEGDNKVVALAISLEQAGGAPSNQGPILFLGKF